MATPRGQHRKLIGSEMSLQNNHDPRWVLLLVGPTGVGKSRLAIELAKKIDGEIISADSRNLYRGMDIGTAKPTLEERLEVAHHLIDIATPDDSWSLARYLDETVKIISDIQARNRLAIITGGTGQYYRALMEGWQIPALAPNEALRSALLEWGTEIGKEALHARLAMIDPQAAGEIDPSNLRRTIRALEVIFMTGERFSVLRRKSGPLFNYYVIGLKMPREDLYQRVDARIEDMISRGLTEEVQRLLDQGYSSSLPSYSAIGYREIAQYLRGEISLEQAKGLMKKNTRQLIRRQANWFKDSDPEIHWYEAEPFPAEKILTDLLAAGILGGSNG